MKIFITVLPVSNNLISNTEEIIFGSAGLSARPIAVTFVDEHIASSLKMWICRITVIVDMGNKI
jgi:hypothetical protein